MRNETRQTRTSLPNIKKAQAKKEKRQNYYPAAFIQIKFMFYFNTMRQFVKKFVTKK